MNNYYILEQSSILLLTFQHLTTVPPGIQRENARLRTSSESGETFHVIGYQPAQMG